MKEPDNKLRSQIRNIKCLARRDLWGKMTELARVGPATGTHRQDPSPRNGVFYLNCGGATVEDGVFTCPKTGESSYCEANLSCRSNSSGSGGNCPNRPATFPGFPA